VTNAIMALGKTWRGSKIGTRLAVPRPEGRTTEWFKSPATEAVTGKSQ